MTVYTHKRWSDEDDQFLIDNADTMTINDVATALNRSYNSVQQRARMFGVVLAKSSKRESVTQEEVDFIIRNGSTMTVTEMSNVLSRPSPTLKNIALRHGVEFKTQSFSVWTDEMLSDLKEFAESGLYYDDIARRLGVSSATVAVKAKELRLTNGMQGLGRSSKSWEIDETRQLVRMYENGDSIADVSRKLSRSDKSIKCKAYKLGLSRPSIG